MSIIYDHQHIWHILIRRQYSSNRYINTSLIRSMRALIKTEASYVRCLQREIKLPSRIRKRASSQTALKETSQAGDSIRSEIDIEKSRRRIVLRLARPLAGIERAPRIREWVRILRCPQRRPYTRHIYAWKHRESACSCKAAMRYTMHGTCRFKPPEKHLDSTIDARTNFVLSKIPWSLYESIKHAYNIIDKIIGPCGVCILNMCVKYVI